MRNNDSITKEFELKLIKKKVVVIPRRQKLISPGACITE
jgi:hypothetical protein